MKHWLTIWTRPKLTVRKLADAGDEGLRVAVLLGVLEGYRYFSLGKPLFEPSVLFLRNFWPSVAATSALAGAIGSVMFVWVGGEVLPWVGRLFGAHPASNEVRTALCWSLVPLLLSSFVKVFVLSLPINLLYGDPRSPGFDQHLRALTDALATQLPYGATMIVVICLLVIPTVCSIIVLVASLSEVLALSLWRTVGTIVIALPLIGLLSSLAILFLQLL